MDISKLKVSAAEAKRLEKARGGASKTLAAIVDQQLILSRAAAPYGGVRSVYDEMVRSQQIWRDQLLKPMTSMISQTGSAVAQFHAQLAAVSAQTSSVSEMFREASLRAQELRAMTDSFAALGGTAFPRVDAARFTLPNFSEISALGRAVEQQRSGMIAFSTSISAAMESMRSPWLSVENPLVSATSLAELTTVGRMLKHRAPFGIDFSTALRARLGDWRDAVSFPNELDDHTVRERLYVDHGLKRELVDFTDDAFDQGMVVANIVLFEVEGGDDEDAGYRRARQMFPILQTLEVQMRRFIDTVMTENFGAEWVRGRAANHSLEEWQAKKDKDPLEGNHKLIQYADMSDYEGIILRKDNWSEVFRHLLGRKDSDVRESFQRLYPARHATVHGRPLGRDDYLMAAVEVRRLLIAIARGRSKKI